jgi:hypothetical protein
LDASDKDREFHALLVTSVEDVIREVLGESPLRAVFSTLQRSFHIKREEIPERLEDFQNALAELFGAGAPVITRAIVRRLCARLGIPYHQRSYGGLKTYVEDCKLRYKERSMVTQTPETFRQRN